MTAVVVLLCLVGLVLLLLLVSLVRTLFIPSRRSEYVPAPDPARTAEYAAKLKESKEEAAQIVSAAVKRAGERENQILAEAQQEAAALKKKAEESIELEKKKAINEIKDQISDIVIMASEKVCEKEISKADNEALIDRFIAEVGKE